MAGSIYGSLKARRLPAGIAGRRLYLSKSWNSGYLSEFHSFFLCGIINQRGCNEYRRIGSDYDPDYHGKEEAPDRSPSKEEHDKQYEQ